MVKKNRLNGKAVFKGYQVTGLPPSLQPNDSICMHILMQSTLNCIIRYCFSALISKPLQKGLQSRLVLFSLLAHRCAFSLALPLFLLHLPALACPLSTSPSLFSLPALCPFCLLASLLFLSQFPGLLCHSTPSLYLFCIQVRQQPPLPCCCFSAGCVYFKYRRDLATKPVPGQCLVQHSQELQLQGEPYSVPGSSNPY